MIKSGLYQDVHYKAQSRHALLQQQYISTPCFLDICPWVFKMF